MNNEGKYGDCFHAELCQCLWHACPSNLFAAPISSCLEFDFESPWWVDQAAPCTASAVWKIFCWAVCLSISWFCVEMEHHVWALVAGLADDVGQRATLTFCQISHIASKLITACGWSGQNGSLIHHRALPNVKSWVCSSQEHGEIHLRGTTKAEEQNSHQLCWINSLCIVWKCSTVHLQATWGAGTVVYRKCKCVEAQLVV